MVIEEKYSADVIGGRFRYFRREHKNISMAEAAEKIGCTKSNFTTIENGRTKPSADFLIRAAEKLNLSPNWLLLGINPIDLPLTVVSKKCQAEISLEKDNKSPNKIEELISCFKKLTTSNKYQILSVAFKLLDEQTARRKRKL